MDRSNFYYILYITTTIVIYRLTEILVHNISYSSYLIFFGAEVPVIIVALLTVYYNKKAEYSGIVTVVVSVLILTYGFIELWFGSYVLASSYVVSLIHWSIGLILGVVVLQAYNRFSS